MRIAMLFIVALVFSGCRSGIEIERPMSERTTDWAQFGGNPQRTNTPDGSITLPLEAAWQHSLSGGQGHPGSLLVDNTVIVPCLREGIDLINAATGDGLGYISLDGVVVATPAVQGDRMYVPVAGLEATMYCIDMTFGVVLWQRGPEPVESPPLIHGDRLYYGTASARILCTGLDDSTAVWTATLPSPLYASPSGVDSVVVFPCMNGDLYGYHAAKGVQLWRYPSGAPYRASAAITEGVVFAANTEGKISAVEVHTGRAVWETVLPCPIYGTPSVSDGVVYLSGTDRTAYALDASTGSIIWKSEVGDIISGSIIPAGDVLVITLMDERIVIAERETGKVIGEYTVEGRIRTSPIVHNGSIYISTDEQLLYSFRTAQ